MVSTTQETTSSPEVALRHSPVLRYLDLGDNKFGSIQRCAFPVSTSALRTLSIIGNPVVCNCSLAWLAAEPGDVGGRRVVWGTCRHVGGLTQSHPDGMDVVIESIVNLATTCTDFEVPGCRFDKASTKNGARRYLHGDIPAEITP